MQKIVDYFIKKWKNQPIRPSTKHVAYVEEVEEQEESEDSYTKLTSVPDLIEWYIFLYMEPPFMFAITVANLILLFRQTHKIVFHGGDYNKTVKLMVKICCYTIILIEICSSVLHRLYKKIAARRPVKPRNWNVIIIDIVCQAISIILYESQQTGSYAIYYFEMFRLIKLIIVFRLLSITPGKHNIFYNVIKFALIMCYSIHIAAATGQMFDISLRNTHDTWLENFVYTIILEKPCESTNYTFLLLNVLAASSNLGLYGASSKNNNEAFLLIILMWLGVFLLDGIFLGSCTSIQIETYRIKATFYNNLKLINKSLEDFRVPRRIRVRIKRYYMVFWAKENATSSSKLFRSLPLSIQSRILVDKYWNILTMPGIFQNTHAGFKRGLSQLAQTSIYAAGEIILTQYMDRDMIMFITRGTIQILSPEDLESPLLTLGVGTCIGEINLIYNTKNPVQVIASSYCVIYSLKKKHLWTVAAKFRKMNQSQIMHFNAKTKLEWAIHKFREQSANSKKYQIKSNNIRSHKLYNLNDEFIEKSREDEVFYRTKFPWVFQASSVFLVCWNTIIVVTVIVTTISLPYYVGFRKQNENKYLTKFIEEYMKLLYILDVILHLFIAVEDENGLHTKVKDIVSIKVTQFTFILDVFAAIPFNDIGVLMGISFEHDLFETLLPLLSLLKFHKIIWFFSKIENTFQFNLVVLRLTKYITYLLFVAYLMGSGYYISACYKSSGCEPNSWVAKLLEKFPYLSLQFVFFSSSVSALLILVLTGGGVIYQTSYVDLIFTIIYVIFGILMFTYIAADFGATLTLMDQSQGNFTTNLLTIKKLLQKSMHKSLDTQNNLKRIVAYLSSQWQFNRGHTIKSLLVDAPQDLYNAHQSAKYSDVLKEIKLFEGMHDKFHSMLATKCVTEFYGVNEIFVYGNEKCTDMYIIERGYCELISGKNRRLEKVLGPGSSICIMELLLGLNNLFFVRPLTSLMVLKISEENLYDVIRNFPSFEADLKQYREEFLASMTARRILNDQIICLASMENQNEMPSFFIFPNDKTEPLYRDFIMGWMQWSGLKYIMMPLTIMPEGKFIIIYEIIYNITSFCLINMCLTIDVWLSLSPKFAYLIYTMQVIQLFNIYVRLHVCYYNKKGILVTHPRMTTWNYLTGAFLTDLVASIPLDLIIYTFSDHDKQSVKFSDSVYSLNRLLLLYRFPLSIYYFTKDELKPRGAAVTILKYLPITVVFMNVCVAILLAVSTTITLNKENETMLQPSEHSLAEHMANLFAFNTDMETTPGHMYLLFFFWVTTMVAQYGLSGIMPTQVVDMILFTLIIISGYLLFTYILVLITNSMKKVNSHLIKHQNHMKHVIRFMKEEKVDKKLQAKAIEYFEFHWQQNHGLTSQDLLNKCHRVLFVDYMYDQYKITFSQVPIFTNLNSTLYRMFSRHLKRTIMLPDITFMRLNDIVYNIYIIHTGEVRVIDARGNINGILSCGSLIGNLDNISGRRNMVSFESITSTELLEMPSTLFYSILSSSVCTNLQKYILLENLSYVKGNMLPKKATKKKHQQVDAIIFSKIDLLLKKVFLSKPINMCMMCCSYISICHVTYVSTYYSGMNYNKNYILFIFDILHVVMIILKFVTPYYDNKGQLIVSRKKIKLRLIYHPWFYFNIAAILPIEIISVVLYNHFSKMHILYRVCLLNRCLRFYNVYKFFKDNNDILNSDMLIMKLTSIFFTVTFVLHIQSCCLCFFTLRGTTSYATNSWAYQVNELNQTQLICGNKYICSLYFATSVMSMSGYMIYPRNVYEVCTICSLILIDKFIMSSSVASLSACIQNYTADLAFFDFRLMRLKMYVLKSGISKPLLKSVFTYTDQLWAKSRGVQQPVLLTQSPAYLQEELKSSAFQKHVINNVVFGKCHPDFLRQLIKVMQIETFFKDDMICQQGDINDTIYFVHQGTVDVLYLTETEEIKVDQLEELDCFGIIQGLFPKTPHTHSFRATTVTVLITLKLGDWYKMLQFFPASKFYIYDKMSAMH